MPTGVFCCGLGCGVAVPGASASGGAPRHWDALGGTAPSVDATALYQGSRSFRFSPVADRSYLRKFLLSSTSTLVASFQVRIDVPPNVKTSLFDGSMPTGSSPGVVYDPSTNKIGVAFGSGTPQAASATLIKGKWYTVDLRFNVSGTTWTVDWALDGVPQTQATKTGQVANAITEFSIGFRLAAATGTARIANLFVSVVAADYPIGNVKIIALRPNRDGTHSFQPGEFKYNDSVVALVGASDIHTYVDDTNLADISDFISQGVLNQESYVEVGFDAVTPTAAALGVEVVASGHAATTLSNAQTVQLLHGSNAQSVFEDVDFSQITAVIVSQHFPLDLTDQPWQKAVIDTILVRWGFSVDNSPPPLLDGLVLEAAFKIPYAPFPGGGKVAAT